MSRRLLLALSVTAGIAAYVYIKRCLAALDVAWVDARLSEDDEAWLAHL